MDIEYIIYDINKLINDHIEKTKYIVKTHFITDTEFRCISVFILGNSMDLLKFDAFKVELFKKFNLYISDFIEIEDGKTFNIYIYSDEYFRRKKLNHVIKNINNNGI